MKKQLLFLGFCFLSVAMFAQKSLPNAVVKTLEGQSMNITDLPKNGKIRVISFWATWCSPCKKELDAISDYYAEWQEKYNFELVAVSVDDARTAPKVKPMVSEKGWEYMVLIDANKELYTAGNLQSVPHTYLLDKDNNIVYEHSGYTPGDELELEEKIKALAGK